MGKQPVGRRMPSTVHLLRGKPLENQEVLVLCLIKDCDCSEILEDRTFVDEGVYLRNLGSGFHTSSSCHEIPVYSVYQTLRRFPVSGYHSQVNTLLRMQNV